MKEPISTKMAPAAIGPYSQAVKTGDLIFFSGQIPLNTEGVLCEGGIKEQTLQVLKNMQAMLNAAGLDFSHVVKTTIYLTDLGDFAEVNDLYGRCFTEPFPARACVEVAGLPKGATVEIEWVAACS